MELGKQLGTSTRLAFALSGNAIFTLRSTRTGKHFTYHLSKGKVRYFAKVRAGEDFVPCGSFWFDDYRPWGNDSPSFAALKWFLRNPESDQVEFFHMGRCGRCGRALTNPESIESGFGPICMEEMGL